MRNRIQPWAGSGSAFFRLLDPDPHGELQLGLDPQKINADPQPWLQKCLCHIYLIILLFFLRVELPRAMTRIGLNTFTLEDIDYFKEYILIMSPVAQALDKLQGEI